MRTSTPSTVVSPACPPDEAWSRILIGEATELDPAQLAAHLGHCTHCQRRLEDLAGLEDFVAPSVKALTPLPGALRAVVDRWRTDRGSAEFAHATLGGEDTSFLMPSTRPGSLGRFASYEVLERIASGGMGVVFKAHDGALDRIVALKILAPTLAANATARARFLREARAGAAVHHENVVTVYAVGEERGFPFIAMQFIAGPSMERRLREGALPLADLLRLGAEMAAGLAAAHAQGLVHRDVKPGNVLLEGDSGRAKLTDFGLARAADSTDVTSPGIIAGTPEFMSPEQARGERIDARSDLFSLGAVLYRALTGEVPFPGETPLSVLRQITECTPVAVRRQCPTCPAWLATLVHRLLARRPEDRFETADLVAQYFRQALDQLQTGVPPDRIRLPGLSGSAAPHRWRAALAISGGAACLVLLVSLFVHSRPTATPASTAAPSSIPPDPSAGAPTGAFRLVRTDDSGKSFDDITSALQSAENGDSVEFAFNGERTFNTLVLRQKALTLRAASGFHPVLVAQSPDLGLIQAEGDVRLEGLELRAAFADSDNTAVRTNPMRGRTPNPRRPRVGGEFVRMPALVRVQQGSIALVHCRLVTSARPAATGNSLTLIGDSRVVVAHSEFYNVGGTIFCLRPESREDPTATSVELTITNCLLYGSHVFALLPAQNRTSRLEVARSTITTFQFFVATDMHGLRMDVARCLIAMNSYAGEPIFAAFPPNLAGQERENIFFPLPNPTQLPVLSHLGSGSVLAKDLFGGRIRRMIGENHRLEPGDFRPVLGPDRRLSGLPIEDLRLRGMDPGSVGPRRLHGP